MGIKDSLKNLLSVGGGNQVDGTNKEFNKILDALVAESYQDTQFNSYWYNGLATKKWTIS